MARETGSFDMANGRTVRQPSSDIDPLSDTQRIFVFDAQISDSAVDLGVAKQQLDGSEIACFAIYFSGLCPAQRVRTVTARLQANRGHPIAYNPAALSRRYVWPVVEAAGEHETAREHLRRSDPDQYRLTCIFCELELHAPLGLALDHRNSFSHTVILHKVAHLKFDQITAAQFAVDRDVEQGKVSQIAREF